MTDIRKNPPCRKDCPDRNEECHAVCERHADWKRKVEAEAKERRKETEAAQGIWEMTLERRGWLKSRGYKAKVRER